MNSDNNFQLRVSEELGKAAAIVDTLQQVIEKLQEDPSKKSPKVKSILSDIKIQFSAAFDGLEAIRIDVDTALESCIVIMKDINSMYQATRRLNVLRTKLEAEEITKTDCQKWIDDLEAIKTTLDKRYQIKRVDSEKQASVSSLTEQLKQKDQLIDQLTLKIQELQKPVDPKNE